MVATSVYWFEEKKKNFELLNGLRERQRLGNKT